MLTCNHTLLSTALLSCLLVLVCPLYAAPQSLSQGQPYGYNQGSTETYQTYPDPGQRICGLPPAGMESPGNTHPVAGWFARYDRIRRQAQLAPAERSRADALLGRGMSMFLPGPEKQEARLLMTRLVNAYGQAIQEMERLPVIAPTERLHRGYHQYFVTARNLFLDYLKVQDNLFVVDPATGRPIAGQLIERKINLETLNRSVRELDEQLRAQLGIGPYQY